MRRPARPQRFAWRSPILIGAVGLLGAVLVTTLLMPSQAYAGTPATDRISPSSLSGFCEPGHTKCSGVGLYVTSAPKSVTITNTGSVSLDFNVSPYTYIAGADPNDFFVGSDNCSGLIGPGSSCSIQVYFQPKASGTRTAEIVIYDNTANSPQKVPLSGIGV